MTPDKSPPTLEALLRLKRSEQPPPEFWIQFEQELRAKQLAAILARRPWWQRLYRLSAPVLRYQVPVGALAILTVTLIGMRQTGLRFTEPVSAPSPERSAEVAAAPSGGVSHPVTAEASRPLISETSSHLQPAPAPIEVPAPVAVASERSEAVPVAREVAEDPGFSVAALPSDVPAPHRDFGTADFSATFASVHPATSEPLARMDPVSEERRSRLLGSSLPEGSRVVLGVNPRVASRLSEDRLYESISRYGVIGDRISIKF